MKQIYLLFYKLLLITYIIAVNELLMSNFAYFFVVISLKKYRKHEIFKIK
jgi:hypothetical protein